MTDERDWGEIAKGIIGLELIIGFFISIGLVLKYGVAPAIEYLTSLIELSAYQQGVFDTITLGIALILFFYFMFSGPTMGRM